MQVDRTNFTAVLPQILTAIEEADFISFDCQFTGLVTKLERIQGMFPNHIQFYERIKETAYNFRIIQLGLCTYTYKDGKYKPSVYNLYISPSTFTLGYNNVMICEVESLEFLGQNKLDFNRVFGQGIKSKRLYSNDVEQKHQYNQFYIGSVDDMFLSPEDQEIVTNIEVNVFAEIINNYKMERIVDFKKKNLFSYLRYKYPDMLLDRTKKNTKPFEYIVRFRPKYDKQEPEKTAKETKAEQAKEPGEEVKQKSQIKIEKQQQGNIMMEPDKVESEPNTVVEVPCLSKVFQALIASKKPIVGHFPNLDIGLIYQAFIADIPETYEQFCCNLTHIFPYLFDTKVISRRIQSKLKGLRVDLPSLFKACSNPKLLKPYANFDITGLESYVEKEHQAGYDAFITGCSFIGMANYLRGESGRVNFNILQAQNLLLFSRFSGQVSVSGNGFCSNATNYDNLIVIQPCKKAQQPQWREVAQQLSKFGSLSVHEDHSQIYYVYEEPINTIEIIKMFPNFKLKHYRDRRIIRARNMYQQFIASTHHQDMMF